MLKIGIIGQKRAGKTTVYNAVAGADTDPDAYQARDEVRRIVVKVPDARLDRLHELFAPPKKINAEIEYFDFPGLTGDAGEVALLPPALRESNALIMVLRGFGENPDPAAEAELITEELVIADLMVLEKRLDRLKREVDSGHVDNKAEYDVLVRAAALLDAGTALRELELSDHEEVIMRGYAFLSRMPIMALINVPDDGTDVTEAEWDKKVNLGSRSLVRVLRGQLESELVNLDDDDRAEFMKDYALEVSALNGMVASCYTLLGMITYFTGSSETDVRAWTVRRGAKAPEAAGVIHSDFEKGFIRAEVFGLEDLLGAGSTTAARKAGKARLEGRDYTVTDGDYILFRFNV